MIDPKTIKKIEDQIQKGLPMVAYCLPDSSNLTVLLQNEECDYDPTEFLENAFHFYPFDTQKRGFCIPNQQATFIQQKFNHKELPSEKNTISINSEDKIWYQQLFDKTLAFLKNRKAEKIVISRKVSFNIKEISFSTVLERLCHLYPQTFRYVWYHPETGLWCGATPELLLQSDEGYFKTMALAGTKDANQNNKVLWDEKERNEHQIVVDEILYKLENILSVIKVSKTYTSTAGPLLHLRTDISGQLKKGKSSVSIVASNLHPTSAVCGMPTAVSKKFILENENYNREFYTGYLGPIFGANEPSFLFVNLRCMKLEKNKAHIFVGGGITKESNAHDEWTETQNKMQPMLQVLQPFM
ncbi:MAG: isochorismate synthase [Flavobacteriaceae bacterium]